VLPSVAVRRLLACGLAILGACVPTAPRDRAYVSDAIQERTGAATGDASRVEPTAAPNVRVDDGVTEDEAVRMALWNNAELHATLEDLGFARAELYRAGALPNPTLSTFLPLGPKQWEFTIAWAIDWLWGRPYRVAAASLDMERVAEELVARGVEVARDARIAHANVVLAERQDVLAREAAKAWDAIAHLARVRRAAGAASLLEVNAVETDARAAKIEADRRTLLVRAAHARLREVLGAEDVVDVIPPTGAATVTASLEDLEKVALAARPEVRAAELAVEAAGERAGWEVARIFQLIGQLDFNAQGFAGGPEAGPGLILTIPLFDQNQAGRTRVDAELRAASWRYIGVRQRILREVAEAYAALTIAKTTRERWPADVLEPLERNVQLATHAYEAGGASYLAVLDANRRRIEAKQREAELFAEERRALAELARSVGRMPE
jgi:cobalt-zinc-cadmium efflux system outer membrane protein